MITQKMKITQFKKTSPVLQYRIIYRAQSFEKKLTQQLFAASRNASQNF